MGEHKIRADGGRAQDGDGEDSWVQIRCDWDKAGERALTGSRLPLNGGFGYGQSHHCADPDDDPFKRRTWHKANPSLRYFPALH